MTSWTDVEFIVDPEMARALLGGLMLAADQMHKVAERSEDAEVAALMRCRVVSMCELIADVEAQTGEDRDSFGEEIAGMMRQCY